jgi:coenzyme F420-0:L-glutamate ligase / coenzyme F420-1:gamma-L-glutamate ligase
VPTELRIVSVPGIPEVTAGADLAELIGDALSASGFALETGDVVVVAQKIVSKSEGAVVALADVEPSPRAREWALAYDKDPAVIEVVLRESRRLVRMERGVIIAETQHGFICANAGVDASNVPQGYVTRLPRDPDGSAARLQRTLSARVGCVVGVIVADTFGRPWRDGVVNVALGVAGLRPLLDYRGARDRVGHLLQSTVIAVADEIAGAAELVMGKTTGTPVAIVRGAAEWIGEGTGAMLLRPASMDLFR